MNDECEYSLIVNGDNTGIKVKDIREVTLEITPYHFKVRVRCDIASHVVSDEISLYRALVIVNSINCQVKTYYETKDLAESYYKWMRFKTERD